MNQHPLTKKSSLIVMGLMMATVSANNLTKWGDPYCSQWNSDGSQCLKCSYHYYRDANCVCQPVSDFCKTWDDNTGDCTSCFPSYGDPVNGKCSNTPVSNGGGSVGGTGGGSTDGGSTDDHCAEYSYVDAKNNWYKSYKDGCKKVCDSCDDGYFLTSTYKCLPLPSNCVAIDDNGVCTTCQNGYTLNTTTYKCQQTVVSVPDNNKPCEKDDHKDCKDKDCHKCKDDGKGNDCKDDGKGNDCKDDGKGKCCDSDKSCDKDSDKSDKDSKSCEEDSKSKDNKDCESKNSDSESTKEDCESKVGDSESKNDDSESKGKDCDSDDSNDLESILDDVKSWFKKNGKGKSWKIQLKNKDDKWEDASKGKDCGQSKKSDNDCDQKNKPKDCKGNDDKTGSK